MTTFKQHQSKAGKSRMSSMTPEDRKKVASLGGKARQAKRLNDKEHKRGDGCDQCGKCGSHVDLKTGCDCPKSSV